MRRAVPRAQPVRFSPLMLSGAEPMPGQDLRLVQRPVTGHCFEGLGDPFVQAATPWGEQGLVCDVAEQRVSKAIASAGLGYDQTGVYQPLQPLIDNAGCKIETLP